MGREPRRRHGCGEPAKQCLSPGVGLRHHRQRSDRGLRGWQILKACETQIGLPILLHPMLQCLQILDAGLLEVQELRIHRSLPRPLASGLVHIEHGARLGRCLDDPILAQWVDRGLPLRRLRVLVEIISSPCGFRPNGLPRLGQWPARQTPPAEVVLRVDGALPGEEIEEPVRRRPDARLAADDVVVARPLAITEDTSEQSVALHSDGVPADRLEIGVHVQSIVLSPAPALPPAAPGPLGEGLGPAFFGGLPCVVAATAANARCRASRTPRPRGPE
mmetsp:Transcript_94359/g.288688  ORF Transcript_94359/g.288688 Transcript_94359/m.288688 type:complete len:276 (+) Transcript_94359:227-1054(+)